MELKPCDRSTIERALGIIEGVAASMKSGDVAADMLITAVEMIDLVLLNKEESA